jgi:hypothetical protein
MDCSDTHETATMLVQGLAFHIVNLDAPEYPDGIRCRECGRWILPPEQEEPSEVDRLSVFAAAVDRLDWGD